jgi:hypothetical protein
MLLVTTKINEELEKLNGVQKLVLRHCKISYEQQKNKFK